jgi:hypothetical protein
MFRLRLKTCATSLLTGFETPRHQPASLPNVLRGVVRLIALVAFLLLFIAPTYSWSADAGHDAETSKPAPIDFDAALKELEKQDASEKADDAGSRQAMGIGNIINQYKAREQTDELGISSSLLDLDLGDILLILICTAVIFELARRSQLISRWVRVALKSLLNFSNSKFGRIGVTVYLLWLLGLLYAAFFFIRERHAFDAFLHLGIMPAIFLVLTAAAYKWIQNPRVFHDIALSASRENIKPLPLVSAPLFTLMSFYLTRTVLLIILAGFVMLSVAAVAAYQKIMPAAYAQYILTFLMPLIPFMCVALYTKPLGIIQKIACMSLAISLFLLIDWMSRLAARGILSSFNEPASVAAVGGAMITLNLASFVVAAMFMVKLMNRWRLALSDNGTR